MISAGSSHDSPLVPGADSLRFGTAALSDITRPVHAMVNAAIPELCRALPPSQRTDAALFLMRYGSALRDGAPDFFRNFHAPSYTVLAHIHASPAAPRRAPDWALERAAAVQAMAMLLHSLDDHLNDGELPATHLALLIRSEAWRRYRAGIALLADGDAALSALAEDLIDAYYRGVTKRERPDTLDAYMERFRDEMATWNAAPLMLARRCGFDDMALTDLRHIYECFGVAWRLLDDLQDAEEDFAARRRAALCVALPAEGRAYWEKGERNGLRSVMESCRAVERIRGIILELLDEGARRAETLGMPGLAAEYRALAGPLAGLAPVSVGGVRTPEDYRAAARENLSIELTTRCGNACAHCFVRARPGGHADMPFDTAAAVLRDAREAGYRSVHLTGGEPLLWNGLYGLVDEAFGLGFESVYLNTTGAPLDAEAATSLARFGKALALSISLQGPDGLNDRLRGEGASGAARRGIELALDAGLAVDVFACAGRSLVPELPRFADDLFRAYPAVQSLTLIQLIRTVRGPSPIDGELLSPADFIALVKAAALLNLYGLRVRVLENPLAGAVAAVLTMPWLPPSPPLMRPGRLVVLADGAIALAHSASETLGTFAPGALAKTLDSPEYRSRVAPDTSACPVCRHVALCREAGMTRPSEWYRDGVDSPPYCVRVLDLAAKG